MRTVTDESRLSMSHALTMLGTSWTCYLYYPVLPLWGSWRRRVHLPIFCWRKRLRGGMEIAILCAQPAGGAATALGHRLWKTGETRHRATTEQAGREWHVQRPCTAGPDLRPSWHVCRICTGPGRGWQGMQVSSVVHGVQ